MPKNACDEPIVLTEREQQLMQTLWILYEDVVCNEKSERFMSALGCTQREYDDLRAKFF